jgi:hypothetical protein
VLTPDGELNTSIRHGATAWKLGLLSLVERSRASLGWKPGELPSLHLGASYVSVKPRVPRPSTSDGARHALLTSRLADSPPFSL